MTPNLARNAYQQTEVNSSNGLQLVVMLYDGAIRFLGQARTCIENKDLHGKTVAVDRSLAIIGELRSTLKLEEGGQIAQSLNTLYPYVTARILESSAKLTVAPMDEAIRLLSILNSAWTEIAQRGETAENTAAPSKHAPAERSVDSGARNPFEIFG